MGPSDIRILFTAPEKGPMSWKLPETLDYLNPKSPEAVENNKSVIGAIIDKSSLSFELTWLSHSVQLIPTT